MPILVEEPRRISNRWAQPSSIVAQSTNRLFSASEEPFSGVQTGFVQIGLDTSERVILARQSPILDEVFLGSGEALIRDGGDRDQKANEDAETSGNLYTNSETTEKNHDWPLLLSAM